MSVTQVSFILSFVCFSWFCAQSLCLCVLVSSLIAQAITTFAKARPPGIYKPDYIDALYAFYHERRPENLLCPPTPEWKRSSEFDLNGEAVPDDDDDGGSAAPVHVCLILYCNLHLLMWFSTT